MMGMVLRLPHPLHTEAGTPEVMWCSGSEERCGLNSFRLRPLRPLLLSISWQ